MCAAVCLPPVAEEEDSVDVSTRNCVSESIVDIAECFLEDGVSTVVDVVRRRIATASERGAAAWKVHEACMLYVTSNEARSWDGITAHANSSPALHLRSCVWSGHLQYHWGHRQPRR